MNVTDRHQWILDQLANAYPNGMTPADLSEAGYTGTDKDRSNDLYCLKRKGQIDKDGAAYLLTTAPSGYNQQLAKDILRKPLVPVKQSTPKAEPKPEPKPEPIKQPENTAPTTEPDITSGLALAERSVLAGPDQYHQSAQTQQAASQNEIDTALANLEARLYRKVRDIDRKLLVLAKLSDLLDPTISEVLQEIAEDLGGKAA